MKRFIDKSSKRGFSLAEALITLLIVCLITLATIPVLTKKKRDLNSSGHGVWMCTRNNAGQYVYYSKEADNGDPSNPETWTPTGQNSCEFKPPAQARNFSLIAVGGGGGGANGLTDYEVKASTNGEARELYFTPVDSAFYDVLVIGGGGGGGDAQNTNDSMGGGGGAGGMFQGYIPLFSGVNYKLLAGGGGGHGGAQYHGGSSDSTSHGWGSAGGASYFQSTNASSGRTTNIVATAGGGGEGVGCSKWKCRGGTGVGGGGGVSGPTYVGSYAFGDAPSRKSEATTSSGKSGSSGTYYYNNGDPFPWGGKSNYKNPLGQVLAYGNGGNGGGEHVLYTPDGSKMYSTRYSFWGASGVNGFVMVSQNIRKFGQGGSAAQPIQQFVPSIKGKIVVEIANAAEPGQSGGTTTAKFVDAKIDNGKVITAYGAGGGISSKDLTVAGNGEHSKWVNAGGGLAAEACQSKRWVPAGSTPQTIKVLTCKKVACNLLPTVTESMFLQVSNKNGTTVDGVTTPKYPAPVETGKTPNDYNLNGTGTKPPPPAFDAFLVSGDITKYMKDVVKLYDYYVKEFGSFSSTSVKNNNMLLVNKGDEAKADFAAYENSSEIYNNYACYSDVNIQYAKDCVEDEYKDKKVTAATEGYWAPASCGKDAGNGTHIGAGGGGGSASETAGIASKGGKGGYGGVIIEW